MANSLPSERRNLQLQPAEEAEKQSSLIITWRKSDDYCLIWGDVSVLHVSNFYFPANSQMSLVRELHKNKASTMRLWLTMIDYKR